MGSIGTQTTASKEELKARLQDLRQDYKDFIGSRATKDGYMELSEDERSHLQRIQGAIDRTTYDLHKQLNPNVPEDKWKGEGLTALSYKEAETARKDMLRNREMFLAIQSAQHGVFYDQNTEDTAVDRLYNKDSSVYNIFKNTRSMLKKKYGDTMTLYRVPTAQTAKATVNMTSTRANAEQYAKLYGRSVEAVKVPVSNVLAVNISRAGGYEEFIVLNRKKKK